MSVQAEPDLCTSCGKVLPEGPDRMHLDAMNPDGPLVLLCAECAAELDPTDDEGEPVDDLDEDAEPQESTKPLAADAPPGDTYGAEQAGLAIGVTARRVRQLVDEGRLVVAQEKPLRVTAQSAHEERDRRRSPGRHPQTAPAPEGVAEQVERLLALFTAESRLAITATESTLREVTAQRDDYRAEAERLRAQVEAERLRADALAERLSTPVETVPEKSPGRPWWRFGSGE